MRDRADHLRKKDEEKEAPAVVDRARSEGPVSRLQDMQRGMGNAAVVELLGAQAKLTVGAVNDPAEAEADRVAAAVLRNLDAGPIAGKEPEGAARMVRRMGAPSAAAAAPGHGLEGGEALPETSAAIDAARGGGKPMDPGTLSRMEGAFGADLSGVRIHTDGQAASLSRDLNAKAFTTGRDVFFGAGEYDPKSRAGTEVLAHELTHTIQQSGGVQGGGEASRKISRLSLDGTDWAATQTFTVSSGGANGVGFLDDGQGKIALKSGEDFPEETTIASNVMKGGMEGATEEQAPPKKKKRKKGEPPAWVLTTPEARALSDAEMTVVKKRLEEIVGERDVTERERKFIDRIGTNNGTIAFALASGKDFKDVIKEQAATTGKGKKQKLDTSSVMGQLFTNPNLMKTLGRAGAFDVFIGNHDRLVGVMNTQNFMVDTKTNTITLVDNAAMADAAAFTTSTLVGRSGEFVMEAEAGFQNWITREWAERFCQGKFGEMGDNIANEVKTELGMNSVRKEDKAFLQKQAEASAKDISAWFAAGLAEGKSRLLLALNDPLKLVAGVSDEKKLDALTSVYARKFALNGVGDGKACWKMGRANAERVLAALKKDDAPEKDEESEGPNWVDNPLAQPKWQTNPLYTGV